MADLVLEIVEGESAGSKFPLDGPVELGRTPGLGVVLDDAEVSRRHARLTPMGGRVTIEDLGSRNGSYVNDQPIDAPRDVGPGDRVRFGLTVLEVHSAQQVARGVSAVVSAPPITRLDHGVLAPVAEPDLPAPAPEPQPPGFLAPESEPAYVPPASGGVAAPAAAGVAAAGVAPGKGSEEGDQYRRVAALRDPRVKPRTQAAAFALLGISALAVIVVFGLLA